NRLSPPSVQRARLRGGKAIGVIAEEAHVEIGVLQWPPSYRAHVDTSRCACPSVRRREPHESRKRSSPERPMPGWRPVASVGQPQDRCRRRISWDAGQKKGELVPRPAPPSSCSFSL